MIIHENFYISKEPGLNKPQAKKRKRNDISRNSQGKYQCQQCDYEANYSGNLRTHVEVKHEGVRYPCSHCKYKATVKCDIKKHMKWQKIII